MNTSHRRKVRAIPRTALGRKSKIFAAGRAVCVYFGPGEYTLSRAKRVRERKRRRHAAFNFPVGLFLAAGLVGKAVMAVLFVASLWCWVLIVEGVVSVVRLRRAVGAARADGEIAAPLAGVVAAGEAEAHRRIPGETVSEVRARIADGMARAARELLTRAEGGLPNLAVISSVAPFIGLFG